MRYTKLLQLIDSAKDSDNNQFKVTSTTIVDVIYEDNDDCVELVKVSNEIIDLETKDHNNKTNKIQPKGKECLVKNSDNLDMVITKSVARNISKKKRDKKVTSINLVDIAADKDEDVQIIEISNEIIDLDAKDDENIENNDVQVIGISKNSAANNSGQKKNVSSNLNQIINLNENNSMQVSTVSKDSETRNNNKVSSNSVQKHTVKENTDIQVTPKSKDCFVKHSDIIDIASKKSVEDNIVPDKKVTTINLIDIDDDKNEDVKITENEIIDLDAKNDNNTEDNNLQESFTNDTEIIDNESVSSKLTQSNNVNENNSLQVSTTNKDYIPKNSKITDIRTTKSIESIVNEDNDAQVNTTGKDSCVNVSEIIDNENESNSVQDIAVNKNNDPEVFTMTKDYLAKDSEMMDVETKTAVENIILNDNNDSPVSSTNLVDMIAGGKDEDVEITETPNEIINSDAKNENNIEADIHDTEMITDPLANDSEMMVNENVSVNENNETGVSTENKDSLAQDSEMKDSETKIAAQNIIANDSNVIPVTSTTLDIVADDKDEEFEITETPNEIVDLDAKNDNTITTKDIQVTEVSILEDSEMTDIGSTMTVERAVVNENIQLEVVSKTKDDKDPKTAVESIIVNENNDLPVSSTTLVELIADGEIEDVQISETPNEIKDLDVKTHSENKSNDLQFIEISKDPELVDNDNTVIENINSQVSTVSKVSVLEDSQMTDIGSTMTVESAVVNEITQVQVATKSKDCFVNESEMIDSDNVSKSVQDDSVNESNDTRVCTQTKESSTRDSEMIGSETIIAVEKIISNENNDIPVTSTCGDIIADDKDISLVMLDFDAKNDSNKVSNDSKVTELSKNSVASDINIIENDKVSLNITQSDAVNKSNDLQDSTVSKDTNAKDSEVTDNVAIKSVENNTVNENNDEVTSTSSNIVTVDEDNDDVQIIEVPHEVIDVDAQDDKSRETNSDKNSLQRARIVEKIVNQNPEFGQLIEKFLNLDNSGAMNRVIFKVLIPLYQSSGGYKKSDAFNKAVLTTMIAVENLPHYMFSHVRNLCQVIKKQKGYKRCRPGILAKKKQQCKVHTLSSTNTTAKSQHVNTRSSSKNNIAINCNVIPIEFDKNDQIESQNIVQSESNVVEIDDDSDTQMNDSNNLDGKASSDSDVLLVPISSSNKENVVRKRRKRKKMKWCTPKSHKKPANYQNEQYSYENPKRMGTKRRIPVHYYKFTHKNDIDNQNETPSSPKIVRSDHDSSVKTYSVVNNNNENVLNPQYQFEVPIIPTESRASRAMAIESEISRLRQHINKLEETELGSDDETSPYLMAESLKERVVKLYQELCKLMGAESKKRHEVRLQVASGHPEGPTRCLEQFLNDNIDENGNPPFPDIFDVLQCVDRADIQYNLKWTRKQIVAEAQALLKHYGRAVKKRRMKREWSDMLSLVKQEVVDPADEDPVLQARLLENSKIAKKNEDEIIEKYGNMEERISGENFSLNVHHESDEDSEDEMPRITNNPQITNVRSEMAGPQITNVRSEMPGTQITNVRSGMPGPQITNVRSEMAGPQITNVRSEMPGPQITNVRSEMAGPQITNVRSEMPGPQITNVRSEMPGSQITNVRGEMAGPQITNVRSEMPRPQITNVRSEMAAPQFTNVQTQTPPNLSHNMSARKTCVGRKTFDHSQQSSNPTIDACVIEQFTDNNNTSLGTKDTDFENVIKSNLIQLGHSQQDIQKITNDTIALLMTNNVNKTFGPIITNVRSETSGPPPSNAKTDTSDSITNVISEMRSALNKLSGPHSFNQRTEMPGPLITDVRSEMPGANFTNVAQETFAPLITDVRTETSGPRISNLRTEMPGPNISKLGTIMPGTFITGVRNDKPGASFSNLAKEKPSYSSNLSTIMSSPLITDVRTQMPNPVYNNIPNKNPAMPCPTYISNLIGMPGVAIPNVGAGTPTYFVTNVLPPPLTDIRTQTSGCNAVTEPFNPQISNVRTEIPGASFSNVLTEPPGPRIIDVAAGPNLNNIIITPGPNLTNIRIQAPNHNLTASKELVNTNIYTTVFIPSNNTVHPSATNACVVEKVASIIDNKETADTDFENEIERNLIQLGYYQQNVTNIKVQAVNSAVDINKGQEMQKETIQKFIIVDNTQSNMAVSNLTSTYVAIGKAIQTDSVEMKKEQQHIDFSKELQELGDDFTATVFDIEEFQDPFLTIEISDSSDSENDL